jgi:hypothetical protein
MQALTFLAVAVPALLIAVVALYAPALGERIGSVQAKTSTTTPPCVGSPAP